MSIDQLASEALRLPAKDRALLAGSLWESLGDPDVSKILENDDEALALSEVRDREIEAGNARPLTHEEMMKRLRG